MRYSSANLAVLLDNLTEDEIGSLLTNPERLEAATKSSKTELRELAELLRMARAQHRNVVPMGLPEKDIFLLLDEDASRGTVHELSGFEAFDE